MIAVVDQGVVSYMRIADAGFGKERVYESAGRGGRGGKRGGTGRGRGRGRGGRR
jgi:tRNA-splicing endonuclease subunit Sen54